MKRGDRGGDAVLLEGDAEDVGRAIGYANGYDIRSEVQTYVGDRADKDRLLRATDHYRSLVEAWAPHWIDEAVGLARAADVDPEVYIAYQGAKYRGINRPECFTYYSAPAHNAGPVTLFHKNRDNRARPQCAYVKGVIGQYRFAATGDTSDIGTMMGVNERGLAAAADTGAPDPSPRFRGMMNPDVMRLILESAADVREAREMLGRVHAERLYAGGSIATNWMFADAAGRGIRVVQFHDRLDYTHELEGLLTMRDDDRGGLVMKTLQEADGRIVPALMNRLSRTAPVLHDTNISAMTAVIPSVDTDLFTWAQFAVHHAGRTVYVPLYLGCTATPRAVIDGSVHRLSGQKPASTGLDATRFEADLDAERQRVEADARAVLPVEGKAKARQVLTEGCLQLAQRAVNYLSACPDEAGEGASQ